MVLGTEATGRHYRTAVPARFLIKGRYIHATDAGRALIHSLPEMAARPDMTAQWESTLTKISEKACRYQDFMQPLVTTLHDLIALARQQNSGASLCGVTAPAGNSKRRPKDKGKGKDGIMKLAWAWR